MRYLKKTLLYLIGNFSGKLLVVLLIPVYAMYVKKGELGSFDYMQTVMNVVITMCYVAIWEAILRFLLAEPKNVKVHSGNIIIFFTLFVSIFVFIASIFITHYIGFDILLSVSNASMYVFYGVAQVWQYFSRSYEKNEIYVLSGIIGTIVNFLMIVILVCVLKKGLLGLIVSYTFGRISIFIFLEAKMGLLKNLDFEDFDLKELLTILDFSFPLAVNSIAGWLISGVGTVIITNKLGIDKNGLYAFANKFSALIISVGSIFIMALIEESIIELKQTENYERVKNYFNIISDLFMSIVVVFIPIIGIFYNLIASSDYLESERYIPFILLYALFSVLASSIGAFFQALDMTKYQFSTTLAGALFSFVFSFLFINELDIYAVLIGQATGALVMMIIRLMAVRNKINLGFRIKRVIIYTVLYITSSITIYKFNNSFIFIGFLIINIGILLVFNRLWIESLIQVFLKSLKIKEKGGN